ncbi:4-(cytidine 5'-diphospho)-2-C-methyl-D-erythritol kinase [Lignipirellula cremea]|uniref:4-diphosphocytidyl-2-C-methyl-D-erythritol kinase n=1 Tax=Lignipirellula cremea TaxID=2528010 RepID=A0A518DUN0_9BACT|nr:4-(cytidine 5'-diphospho)-2-C-methyl-D-erythritol kinase [Lignipirellula cremea]QDU95539.1 4-diphosphocytidyl-2-C-methyl-D-erythritol kinase [Lignipirellula cremea]
MYMVPRDRSIEVRTPAKINLFLEVLSRRPDGFHEIETLMSAVSLFDRFDFTPQDSGRLDFSCQWATGVQGERWPDGLSRQPELPSTENNLAFLALQKLQEHTEVPLHGTVRLVKRIPAAAGLGGASSDAAAALLGANVAWKLGKSLDQLSLLSSELGSDIPFFFQRYAAVCQGRGERIARQVMAPRLHLVIVRPPEGLSTPAVYRACRPASAPRQVQSLLAAWQRGRIRELAGFLYNGLEEPASRLSPWIDRLNKEFLTTACLGCRMSGSGTSYFGVYRTAACARRAAALLRSRGVGQVFYAVTLSQGLSSLAAGALTDRIRPYGGDDRGNN